MNFTDRKSIENEGFSGFVKIADLRNSTKAFPKEAGVYMVLRPDNSEVEFLPVGTGGHFKGKNPNVEIQVLKDNWVENTAVVYIGKAGSLDGDATLQSRLGQYIKFGMEKNIGHWGGRLIWQIKGIEEYVICWKVTPGLEPRAIEVNLIEEFKSKYHCLPFANLSN